jgi:molybdate transport system substrate-binding protein
MKLAALAAAILLGIAILPTATPGSGTEPITVLAASSLGDVLPRIDSHPRYGFGGSDQLAFQIREGAPADVFAAASPQQPEELFRAGRLYRPVVFATNRLVVVVPRSNRAEIDSLGDVTHRGIKLVIAAAGVPVGDYTRRMLQRLGLTSALENVVSEEDDVRGVLAKVAFGEADAGFVYATDVRAAAGRVRSIAIPQRAQPTIRYQIAVVRSTEKLAAARAFVRRVLGPRGRSVLREHGFGLP